MKLKIYTFEQYAKEIGVSKKTIYNRYKNGTLENVKIIYIGKQPHIAKMTTLTKNI